MFIIDNSNDEEIKKLCTNPCVEYIKTKTNLGFGAAHNIGISESQKLQSNYHLIVNPDIYFEKNTIESLISYAETDQDIGLLMPKILYPNNDIQYLCKLLPNPMNLIFRRFIPIKKIVEKMNLRYELRFSGYDKIMNVPYLSGCFMFCRTSALEKVGSFDERFFMYLEDIDLSRRLNEHYKTIYYPLVKVYHKFEKGSYKNKKLLNYHIKSTFMYFNKWGWIFDKQRKESNNLALKQILKDAVNGN